MERGGGDLERERLEGKCWGERRRAEAEDGGEEGGGVTGSGGEGGGEAGGELTGECGQEGGIRTRGGGGD